MDAAPVLIPFALLAIAFIGFCLYDLTRHETNGPKWMWAILTVASVPLGGVLYLLVGRRPPPVAEVSSGAPPTPGTMATLGASRDRPGVAGEGIDRSRPALRTTGLTKAYPGHTAVDHVDLEVPRGSVFGLVGPNGAGKTTLLSLIAGLRRPTEGGVALEDADDRLAVLPDTPTFEPWLTAREVVDLARRLVDDTIPAAATDEVLRAVGLADAADRRTGGFSRGMLQRLGLAATMVGEPTILLLDEPCSALDPVGRREVLDLVARLGGERTVLFCSHILGDVQEVCDTVGVLRDGRLLYQGALTDLLVGHAAPAYAVRVRPPVAPVVAALSAEPWVVEVEQVGAEELRVGVTALADAEAGFAAALAGAGAHVVSITPVARELEHVFLELLAAPA